jgi:hypothetical protein
MARVDSSVLPALLIALCLMDIVQKCFVCDDVLLQSEVTWSRHSELTVTIIPPVSARSGLMLWMLPLAKNAFDYSE